MKRYYINGQRSTRKAYEEQKKTNDQLLKMEPRNVKEWETWLEEMKKGAFLTVIG